MTTAQRRETIDRLRSAARLGVGGGAGEGAGYALVELGRSQAFWEGDGSDRVAAAEQIGAEYTALVQALTDGWGEPDVVGMGTVQERWASGEEIPAPWREVSGTTDHVHLWRVAEEWVAVYAAAGGEEQPLLLMAAVTATDPP
ncbi:hypothetical protein [Streptomyces sp. NPDC089919]|uniref:hypothetical protein n=1 Tax=Streptomyces sp. NPDC089919 TaxID=3155188 RepID=UPI0034467F54